VLLKLLVPSTSAANARALAVRASTPMFVVDIASMTCRCRVTVAAVTVPVCSSCSVIASSRSSGGSAISPECVGRVEMLAVFAVDFFVVREAEQQQVGEAVPLRGWNVGSEA
jgi:hypothetical protein